jgi:Secretion system C-terminal sorting domain
MKKSILLLIAFFLLINSVNGQSFQDSTRVFNILDNANYVFEGKVIDQCCYKDPVTMMLFTKSQIQMSKIFKGNITCGTIDLTQHGGMLNDEASFIEDAPLIKVGYQGIFATRDNHFPIDVTCNYNNTNPSTQFYSFYNGTIDLNEDNFNPIINAFDNEIYNINYVYSFLQSRFGITITNCNSNFSPATWINNDKFNKQHNVRGPIPVVTSINGTTISPYPTQAGVGDSIKLVGNNFGAVKGKLYVTSADNGSKYVQLTSLEIKWTDTLISFPVNSMSDSAGIVGYKLSAIGSGVFGIQNTLGDVSDTVNTSSALNKLDIRYNVLQHRATVNDPVLHNTVILHRKTDSVSDDIVIYLNKTLKDTMKQYIKSAGYHWRCLIGAPIVFIEDSNKLIQYDKYNVIGLDSFLNNSLTTLGYTIPNYTACTPANYPSGLQIAKSSDIMINPMINFWYDSTDVSSTSTIPIGKEDFYSMIIHEIGHLLNLGHVNNSKDVMYYGVYGGGNTCDKRNFILNNKNQKAGDVTMKRSAFTTLTNNCLTNYKKINNVDTTCRLLQLAIINSNKEVNNIEIFPNPFINEINITSSNNDKFDVIIYDILGNIIFKNFNNFTKTKIQLPNKKAGLYIIKIIQANSNFQKIVICQ